VASPSANHSQKGGARKEHRGSFTRFSYEEQKSETSPREVDYVEGFLQTISEGEYREVMRWILQISATNNLDMQVILKYIRTFGKGALRKKLRGWLNFFKYCELKQISVNDVVESNSLKLITDFMLFLRQQGSKDYTIQEAKYAVSTLFEDILGKQGSGRNKLIAAMMIPEKLHVPHKKRYSEIWNINLLFDYYRNQPVNSLLSSFDVMIKSAILILAFTACRPKEIVTINVDSIVYKPETGTLLLPTITKQERFELTNLQIQEISDKQICPVAATREWLARRNSLDNAPPKFMITKTGKPMLDAQLLAIAIRNVLDAAKVPPQYGSYSIKHAAISALYALGFSTTEINIFTGHSESADTAPSYYLKTIGNWPGYRLAAFGSPEGLGETMAPNPPKQ
jgi:integrase